MTYEEIGEELDISKQAVSQLTKKAVNKVYKTIVKTTSSPFEAIKTMTLFFNIDNHDDFKQMFKILDNDTKEEIQDDEEWNKYKPLC